MLLSTLDPPWSSAPHMPTRQATLPAVRYTGQGPHRRCKQVQATHRHPNILTHILASLNPSLAVPLTFMLAALTDAGQDAVPSVLPFYLPLTPHPSLSNATAQLAPSSLLASAARPAVPLPRTRCTPHVRRCTPNVRRCMPLRCAEAVAPLASPTQRQCQVPPNSRRP